jgi:GMP synthase-like glutamine amidotransferase
MLAFRTSKTEPIIIHSTRPQSGSDVIPIALIDLNAGKPNLGVSAIESRLREAAMDWTRFEPRVEGSLPSSEIAGAILTGGPGSPLENLPWRGRVMDWLEAALPRTPVLGICMGCQLLASAYGYELRELGSPRFGIYPLGLTAAGEDDSVLGQLDRDSTVFEQRRWGIFPGPKGPSAVALARAETGEATALRFGPGILGTVFHPEAAPTPVRNWIRDDQTVRRKVLQRHGPEGMAHQLSLVEGLATTWDRLIPGFLRQFDPLESQ